MRSLVPDKTNYLKNIKAILFDIDGVLTDGSITIDSNGDEIKSFNVKDGQLIEFMQFHSFIFGAISGRSSLALISRLNEMNVDFHRLGVRNKITALEEFANFYKLDLENIAYIGDDIIDIEVMQNVGWSFAPADASVHVLNIAKTITFSKGGKGVLREVIEMIILENNEIKVNFNNFFKIY